MLFLDTTIKIYSIDRSYRKNIGTNLSPHVFRILLKEFQENRKPIGSICNICKALIRVYVRRRTIVGAGQ